MPKTGIDDRCPTCNYELDAAENLDDPNLLPKCGDITVCINCAEILEYNDNMKLKKANVKNISQEQFYEVVRIVRAIQHSKRSNGRD